MIERWKLQKKFLKWCSYDRELARKLCWLGNWMYAFMYDINV